MTTTIDAGKLLSRLTDHMDALEARAETLAAIHNVAASDLICDAIVYLMDLNEDGMITAEDLDSPAELRALIRSATRVAAVLRAANVGPTDDWDALRAG